MKRLTFPIWLLMVGQVFAYGTSKEDTTSAITFYNGIGMDSVRYYAGQDTSSWEINRLMVRGFSPDSTNYVLIDTFDNPGTYFVKIVYWEGGVDSSGLKVLPDIRYVRPANYGIDWANITNPSGSTPDVNIERISGDAQAATNLEAILDGTGADLTVDSLHSRAVVFQNSSGSGRGLYIEGTGHAVHLKTNGAGMSALYADGSGGTSTNGFKAEGGGSGTDFTGNLSGSVASVTAAVPVDFNNVTGELDDTEIADDLTFDSLHYRTVVINQTGGSGYGLYIASNQDNDAALIVDGTGTNTDGARFSGTGLDFNATLNLDDLVGDFETADFEDSIWTAIKFATDYWAELADRADSGAAGGTGLDSATTARIVGRITWGIPAGSGDDSSTIAQRRVGWVDTTNYALNVPGAGTGVNACSLWLYDTGNSVMVSDIMVQAENSSGANQGRNRTNVSGISVLNLNDGDYNLRIPMNSGYIQTTNPQPFTVSGATNDTIDVTAFSPTAPAGDLTTLYNWIVDGSDQPIANANVEAMIPMEFWPVTNSRKAINAKRSVKTDSVGLWELPIWGNDIVLTDQGDSSSFWMVTITYLGQEISRNKVTVSSDSTTQLMVPDSD